MTESIAGERSLDERLARYLGTRAQAGGAPEVQALTGDASDRRYFRVSFTGEPSIVLAVHTGSIDFATLPFANVAELLHQVPLPIPRILGHSDVDGIIEQTDLGDVTLQAHVAGIEAGARQDLYSEAVALIERLQRRGTELASDRYIPYRSAFDVEKLAWEMNFFVRHFLEAYRGASISTETRNQLAEEWEAIVSELAAEPRVLCHRDYHSRNLMVVGRDLHVIDFQDARMGPDTYDLVSLLRDAYVAWDEERQLDWAVRYWERARAAKLPVDADFGIFWRDFEWMGVQRQLKVLGIFARLNHRDGKAAYLADMPRVMAYLRGACRRYAAFDPLTRLIDALEGQAARTGYTF